MTEKLELTFSSRLTSEQRDVAEASVRGMIEKANVDAAAAQALRAQRQELHRALTAPIDALILADAKAAAALKALSKDASGADGFEPLQPADVPDRQGSRLPPPRVSPYLIAFTATPPFDYAWKYTAAGSGQPHQSLSDVQGNLIAGAVSGSIAGGADRFVNTHCGVGTVINLDRTAGVYLDAALDYRYKYQLDCQGVGAAASADGGLDAALLRGPTIITLQNRPFYHKRISGFEDESIDVPYGSLNFPHGLGSQVGPGSYGFNLGIWAVSDYSSGIGQAAAQSYCQAVVREMRVAAI